MGPVIGVPNELAQRIKDETDLVEVDAVLPDVVDVFDVQIGATPEDILLLVETPKDGFGPLVSLITDFAQHAPGPFELVVSDEQGNPHALPGTLGDSPESVRDHLKLAFFGEPGDRRPLLRDDAIPAS